MPPEGERLTAEQIGRSARGSTRERPGRTPQPSSARPQESLGLQGARPPAVPRGEEHRLGEDADRRLRPRAAGEGGPRARRPRRTRSRCSAASRSTSPACRRRSQEVDAFLADNAPDAYEKQVERLLARRTTASAGAGTGSTPPATPTRDGYEKDKPRYVWFYRDWVINALNRDLPYDQFVIEQLAGDLLPNADAGPDRRHRLPAQLDDQRGRRHRPRAVPHGGDVRPHGRHRQGRARPDDPVRPVPQPQVRSAHAGRVLPAVRLPEQRPRRQHAVVYTPDEQMQRGRACCRQIGEIEDELAAHARPTGQSGWRVGGAVAKAISPSGRSFSPTSTTSRPAARRYLPQPDGSFLAQGYAPTKHDGEVRRRRPTCTNITAFRLELLNDPNLPLRRPGPLVQGHVRADRVRRRSRRRDGAGQDGDGEARQGDRRRRARRRRRSSRTSTTSPSKKRVTGPVDFAIDGKDETAWGIDAGPGPPQRAAQGGLRRSRSRSSFADGHAADVPAEAEPRRLEQRRPPEQ